ncbi:MAG TPA: alginate lyase family protein [Gemmatimonadales bacterium]|nr:alginate lyase family protein [Gemmatimonadales bacterium]
MIGRLRGRSIGELRFRGAQLAAVFLERAGWHPEAREPAPDRLHRILTGTTDPVGLLENFRARPAPVFPAMDQPAEAAGTVRELWPAEAESIVAAADRALEGRFDLLGHRELSFGEPIDWRFDPLSGRRSPLRHWSQVPYLEFDEVGDHKVVWELNRHQHFVTLAQAYALTGDERYPRALVSQLTSWIDANPPKLGMNWASSLEVAFRAISWTWALFLVRRSDALTPEFYRRVLGMVHVHARHLERNLSTYFSPNTHLTGEALGLVYIGTHFPELRSAGRWIERGERILLSELDRQLRPDGVYFEQSSYYHRYTADFYLHLALLGRKPGKALDERLTEALEAVLDHTVALMRPDRRWPLFGDDDGGRLLMLKRRDGNDFRDTLALGGALLERPEYCFGAGAPAPELVWLLGSGGPARFERMGMRKPGVPADYPDGGYFLMRDGWASEANYLLVDCGPLGGLNGGHGHADTLAIEVAAHGRPMLVDPGTFTYVATSAERDAFRSSRVHSTVTVEGRSSSVPATPFRWASRAEARLVRWEASERSTLFEGEHNGYADLDPPAVHRRAILFIPGRCWIVRDTIVSTGDHPFEARWHAAPGLAVEQSGERACTLREGSGAGLLIAASAGALGMEAAWSSPVFGSRVPSAICVSAMRPEDGNVIVTALVPAASGVQPVVNFLGDRVRVSTPAWTQEVLVTEGLLRLADGGSGQNGVS